ncbi:MAG TPA: lactate utilization protein [Chloroflexia bacterium]|nr:lactate utilization protein [Chloroflexia bacterium]
MLGTFRLYAKAAGAEVFVCAGEHDAATAIARIASGPLRCTSGVWDRYPGICRALESMRLDVAEAIAVQEPERSALAAALAGGVGIVLAKGAVAETGSLVLADDALAPRLLSMLAEVCIALLPASTIVPSLDEAGALLAELERAGHRYVSLVTGPSRTADIERVLTIGVQGPKALHIIILTEEGA